MVDPPGIDRRRLLAGAGALVSLGIVGCSDDTSLSDPTGSTGPGSPGTAQVPGSSAAPQVTSQVEPVASTFDAEVPYWLQGGFAPVDNEVDETTLEVTGTIPPDLLGTYVRNGSNPANGTSPHWFFGDGMLHSVTLDGGRATAYRNRWIQTPVVQAGGGLLGDDAADLGPPGNEVTQSNVSVFSHGGRLLASGEVGWLYEIEAGDLSTVGPYGFDPTGLDSGALGSGGAASDPATGGGASLGPNVTAHPKIDPATGYLHFFGYGFTPPYLTYYVADPAGQLVHAQVIDVTSSTMIHDFAITETDVVFWEMPVLFDLQAALGGADNPYSWSPEYGSRLGVMPLWAPGASPEQPRWVEIDNGYVFHGTNAWRDGDRITVDVSRLDKMFDGDGGLADADNRSLLTRWTIDTSGSDLTAGAEQLDEVQLDLPMIDRRFAGRRHRASWYVEPRATDEGDLEFVGLVGRDSETGVLDRWEPGPDRQPNEPFFVPAAPDDPSTEGEGWLLTYVWNRADDTSSLAILDSTDLAAGPVGEVSLPQRVPFGFHGAWLPA